ERPGAAAGGGGRERRRRADAPGRPRFRCAGDRNWREGGWSDRPQTFNTPEAEMNGDTRELIIIGGGPSGYTAALYPARANLQPLVIEGFAWGGPLMLKRD